MWIKLFRLHKKYIPDIAHQFYQRRAEVDKERRMDLRKIAFVRKLKKLCLKCGPDIESRTTKFIPFSLMVGAQAIKDNIEVKCKGILKTIATDATTEHDFRTRLIQT